MNKKSEFERFAISKLGMSSSILRDVNEYQTKNYGLTPMILEERKLNVTQLSVFDRMLLDRILWVSGEVDDVMGDIVQAQLLFLESTDPEKEIDMMLTSPGGSVLVGLGIRDVMNYVKPDVRVTNLGMAASMGSILLSSGAKGERSGLINSKVMIHHVSGGNRGTVDDMRISQMEAEKYNFLLFKILAENCGKSFNDIHDESQRDKWLNSDEALEYGIIDKIIGLKDDKSNSITTMMDGFDDYYKKYVMQK
jgi:ATP-dependent Clp protease protease subunit